MHATIRFVSTALLALPLVASCDKGEVKAEAGTSEGTLPKVEGLDTSKLTEEATKQKVTSLSTELSGKLGKITDAASAKDVSAQLEPILDQLDELKKSMQGKLPSMDQLKKVVDELKKKFADNPEVMQQVKPLLDRIEKLFA